MFNKFSVVVPTCNRAELLVVCLNKLLQARKFSPIPVEIIVTDDTELSNEELVNWLKDSGIIYVKGPRKGPASNRNNGAAFASGNWLVFIDDDCEPDINIYSAYYNAIIINPDIAVFEGSIQVPPKKPAPLDYAPENTSGGKLWSCNFCIKKDFFNSVGKFDEKFKFPHMEDIDLADRIRAYPAKILFLPSAFVVHPWRKLNNGRKLGLYQEMYVYYLAKNNKKITLAELLRNIIYHYFSLLKKNIFSSDVPIAISMAVIQLWTVILNFKKWKYLYHS